MKMTNLTREPRKLVVSIIVHRNLRLPNVFRSDWAARIFNLNNLIELDGQTLPFDWATHFFRSAVLQCSSQREAYRRNIFSALKSEREELREKKIGNIAHCQTGFAHFFLFVFHSSFEYDEDDRVCIPCISAHQGTLWMVDTFQFRCFFSLSAERCTSPALLFGPCL